MKCENPIDVFAYYSRRTSHEVRGLKYELFREQYACAASHLTRGAWIEICVVVYRNGGLAGRTSHEVRGLKYIFQCARRNTFGVAPHTRCVD